MYRGPQTALQRERPQLLADSMEEPFEPTAGRTASRPVNLPAPTTLLRGYLAKLRGKLGAANRTEAVARARELSLIP